MKSRSPSCTSSPGPGSLVLWPCGWRRGLRCGVHVHQVVVDCSKANPVPRRLLWRGGCVKECRLLKQNKRRLMMTGGGLQADHRGLPGRAHTNPVGHGLTLGRIPSGDQAHCLRLFWPVPWIYVLKCMKDPSSLVDCRSSCYQYSRTPHITRRINC